MVDRSNPEMLDLARLLADGMLTLHYQPIVELGTFVVRSLEALVRWSEPDAGPSPQSLVRRITSAGEVSPLGTWVLRTAVEQLAEWRQAYPATLSISMAVNVSPAQFDRDDLASHVLQVLEEYDVPSRCLQLEITEDLLMDDTARTIARLEKLNDHGVRIVIDDFGTGYSSLAYLERFPVSAIKIDRCFVEGLPHRGNDSALVRSMLWLGHALGVSVVAEGVERQEQADALQQMGCRLAQGFLFAPPLRADKVPDVVQDRGRMAQTLAEQRRRIKHPPQAG